MRESNQKSPYLGTGSPLDMNDNSKGHVDEEDAGFGFSVYGNVMREINSKK